MGIFPARPKTSFVLGGAPTRDKRPFCPGSWLHPGQKPPYITLLLPRLLPQHFAIFLISAGAPSSRCSIRRLLLAIVVVPRPPPWNHRPAAPKPARATAGAPPHAQDRLRARCPRPPPCTRRNFDRSSTQVSHSAVEFPRRRCPPAALTTSLALHRDAEPARGDQKTGAVLQRPRPRALSSTAAGSRRRPSCTTASSTSVPL